MAPLTQVESTINKGSFHTQGVSKPNRLSCSAQLPARYTDQSHRVYTPLDEHATTFKISSNFLYDQSYPEVISLQTTHLQTSVASSNMQYVGWDQLKSPKDQTASVDGMNYHQYRCLGSENFIQEILQVRERS